MVGAGDVVRDERGLGRIGKFAKTLDEGVLGLSGGGGLFLFEAGEELQERPLSSSIGDMQVVCDGDEMPLLSCGCDVVEP